MGIETNIDVNVDKEHLLQGEDVPPLPDSHESGNPFLVDTASPHEQGGFYPVEIEVPTHQYNYKSITLHHHPATPMVSLYTHHQ
eukprot:gene14160-16688_t